jgi:hypothetical protein
MIPEKVDALRNAARIVTPAGANCMNILLAPQTLQQVIVLQPRTAWMQLPWLDQMFEGAGVDVGRLDEVRGLPANTQAGESGASDSYCVDSIGLKRCLRRRSHAFPRTRSTVRRFVGKSWRPVRSLVGKGVRGARKVVCGD